MRKLSDRKCPYCETVYIDVLHSDSEPHTCTCGRATITYFGGAVLSRNAEVPVVFGSVKYSPSEWRDFCQNWRATHHEDLVVEGDSPRARKARLEESHHATLQEAKRRGMHRLVRDIESAGSRIR